jgi:hypothetical protein
METLSDVAIKVLGYSYTVNASDTYQKEDVPVYDDPEIWNLFEPTKEDMDRFLCYLNQLIYSFNDYPLLAMSITSPLMDTGAQHWGEFGNRDRGRIGPGGILPKDRKHLSNG